MHGDQVAIELLPKSEWTGKISSLSTTGEQIKNVLLNSKFPISVAVGGYLTFTLSLVRLVLLSIVLFFLIELGESNEITVLNTNRCVSTTKSGFSPAFFKTEAILDPIFCHITNRYDNINNSSS